ncbi:MAG TPA: hypothetical protein VIT65_08310 [Microlunatus sp.]
MDSTPDEVRQPSASAQPDLSPSRAEQFEIERILTVDQERFRVRLRRRRRRSSEYDYDWLTGPNAGYGFSSSGPIEQNDRDHRAQIRAFLAEIDPATGYLRDD